MKLGIQMMDSDSTLNNLIELNQVELSPGETTTVMFQLINSVSNQRYIPATGATMTARMMSSNNANIISKSPTQPFVDDKSIWSFPLTSADTSKVAGVNLEITLTEGANIKKVWAQSVIVVSPNSPFKA